MKLAQALATEASIPLARIMLLRHFKGKVEAIRRCGASLEEFTLTQPKGTPYDFFLTDRESIEIVGVIADDRLVAVYRIVGIEKEGSNRVITSTTFRSLDGAMRYPERTVRRFTAQPVDSAYVDQKIAGWSNMRVGTARIGGKLFDSVYLVRLGS
jgi:hypothetical protein